MAPIVFGGPSDGKIYVTDDPIDGLVLSEDHRHSTIVVTGANPSMDLLLAMLSHRRHQGLVLAFSHSPLGEQMHAALAGLLQEKQIPMQFLRPHDEDATLGTWKEVRISRRAMETVEEPMMEIQSEAEPSQVEEDSESRLDDDADLGLGS